MSTKITIHLFENDMVGLRSDELSLDYANMSDIVALRSNYEEGDNKYDRQLELCNKIIELSKELTVISNKK